MQNQTSTLRRLNRTVIATAIIGSTALGLAACGSDDDVPDDTEVNVITSEVSVTSIATVDSEVTIGTTVISEVEVVKDTTLTSEVEVEGTVTEVSEVKVTSEG